MTEWMDAQTDGHTGDQLKTIIPCHYHVAGYKKGEIGSNFFSFPQYFVTCVNTGTRFSLQDKWLFEISEVVITRVKCT